MGATMQEIVNEAVEQAIKNERFRLEILHAQVEYAGRLLKIKDSIRRILWEFKKQEGPGTPTGLRTSEYKKFTAKAVDAIFDLFVVPSKLILPVSTNNKGDKRI